MGPTEFNKTRNENLWPRLDILFYDTALSSSDAVTVSPSRYPAPTRGVRFWSSSVSVSHPIYFPLALDSPIMQTTTESYYENQFIPKKPSESLQIFTPYPQCSCAHPALLLCPSAFSLTLPATRKWWSRWRPTATRSARSCKSRAMLTSRGGWTSTVSRYPLSTRRKGLPVASMTALGF